MCIPVIHNTIVYKIHKPLIFTALPPPYYTTQHCTSYAI